MIDLRGKKVLVTGAAAGIGRATAELAAAAGADVTATDIVDVDATALSGKTMTTARLDVTDQDMIDGFAAATSGFDGIVNAAGYVHHGTVADTSDDAWRRSFSINVDGMFRILRAFVPGMLARRGGSIVNIASLAASTKGFAFRAAYGASKAAVIGLTKSVAVDYMADGIRCNAICPGTIDTPSLRLRIEALSKELGSYEAAEQRFIDRQPNGRLGKPEEIGTFAVYLLSDAASFATGQAYAIDGGILA